MITLQPMNIQSAAADLLWSRVLKNFPDLRVALSEGGTGWIPYFLDRLDRTYEMHRAWTLQDFGGRLPSEVFREHFLTCFISDPVGRGHPRPIGVDNMCWEADYPHSDSMWPTAPEELSTVFGRNDVPDDEIDKITHGNAMRWYSFDPFAHVPKAEATVGALRAGPPATTCRSCPAAPGSARPTRSSRASASGPSAAVAPEHRLTRPRVRSGTRRGLSGSPAASRPGRRGPQPVAQGGPGVEHMGLGDGAGRGRVAPADGVEQRGVLGPAPAAPARGRARSSWPAPPARPGGGR